MGLRLNGRDLGTRQVNDARSVSFEVGYEPGELVAVGFRQGEPVVTNHLMTAGAPAALRVETDRPTLPADGRSVAHVVVSIVDATGNLVQPATDLLTVDTEGAGSLLGIDNGDMNDPISLKSRSKKANGGRVLVLLQAGNTSGALDLKVIASGLKSARLTVPVIPVRP